MRGREAFRDWPHGSQLGRGPRLLSYSRDRMIRIQHIGAQTEGIDVGGYMKQSIEPQARLRRMTLGSATINHKFWGGENLPAHLSGTISNQISQERDR